MPNQLTQTHPFPILTAKPQSGLTFPWTFYNPNVLSTMDASFGPDGVVFADQIIINFADLGVALQQLLGYSWRDTGPNANLFPGALRRNLPWQHPYVTEMFVKNISSVKGISQAGPLSNPADGPTNQYGAGFFPNRGPWNNFQFLLLTLHFWRPPYAVRSDQDILILDPYAGTPGHVPNPNFPAGMIQAEWKRYVSKDWEASTQMLTREGTTFIWSAGQTGITNGKPFQGAVGQPVTHQKLMRKWYELPEEAIFGKMDENVPNGLPTNFVYTQNPTANPITGSVYQAGSPIAGCVNVPIGGGSLPFGNPPTGTTPPYVLDNDPTLRLFGCRMGTLRLDGIRATPRPLQMPPWLMQIASFGNNEPVSQQQYDVEFHFDLFEPPIADGVPAAFAGHNLMPWSGNGRWYAVRSQYDQIGQQAGPPPLLVQEGPGHRFQTPFQYADMSDLFLIL